MNVEELRRRLQAHPGGDAAEIRAAVVVPLREGRGGLEILFEQRPMHLTQSPGEVSFPGGRVETGETPLEAALRELEEELGVPPARVEVLGRLAVRQRRRGEFVHPFVCLLDADAPLRPQEAEVEELFAIPLDALLDREPGEARIIEEYTLSDEFPAEHLPVRGWKGRQERPVYYFHHERYFIWGLTAAILLEFLRVLGSEKSPVLDSPPEPGLPAIFGENPR
jgi:coenzyme A diphosphatase NUDT7